LRLQHAPANREEQLKADQSRIAELEAVAQLLPYLASEDQIKQKYAITAIQILANAKIATELAKLYPTTGAIAGVAAIATQADTTADRQIASRALQQIYGVENWDLKTLTDPESSQVTLQPTHTRRMLRRCCREAPS
jgi:hypothetical protein